MELWIYGTEYDHLGMTTLGRRASATQQRDLVDPIVSMDTASLLISDPSYVLHKKQMDRDFGRNYEHFVEHILDGNHKYGRQLKHNKGHAGLGVVVFSGGDGTVNVYVKPDGYGSITEARIMF